MHQQNLKEILLKPNQWKDKSYQSWKCLDMNMFWKCRVTLGHSIKKRNVLPLSFSLECRSHCFTNNHMMMVGFNSLLFTSFPLESLHVQNKVIFMDSCPKQQPIYWHKRNKGCCWFINAWSNFEEVTLLYHIPFPWGSCTAWESVSFFALIRDF